MPGGEGKVKKTGAESDVENGGHFVVDLEVSESVSAGEFPSDVTLR